MPTPDEVKAHCRFVGAAESCTLYKEGKVRSKKEEVGE